MHECSGFPEYTVRVSPRAKRVILKISRDRGLEVVTPRGFDRGRLPEVLDRRRDWIERQYDRMREQGAIPGRPARLPDTVTLSAVDEVYEVSVVKRTGPGMLEANSAGRLMLAVPGIEEGRLLLREWLKGQARIALPPMLRQEGRRTGLGFERTQVRMQRSRWASFSARGTVSLNARLMFLPPELTRYVLVHELCHVKHLNHSPAYWRLVERFEPEYRVLEQRLKKEAGGYVPDWAV